jgi:protein-S-isoprenylcysteine O-methyltransferase Ste14
LILMAVGIILRQWAVLVLGRYFSETVAVQEGQKVVDTGPYRYIRHPAYTGVLIVFLGIGLAIQSWGATLLLLVVFALAYGYRISVEEKALASELGDEYVRYMKGTKRLIPFIL